MSNAADLAEGLAPTLPELLALRALAGGRRGARLGRFGVSGHALSPMRGRGMEYAESREYVAGDDARHIDWRLTARSGRAHTKLFQAERERLTLIVADTAPTMYFGTHQPCTAPSESAIAAPTILPSSMPLPTTSGSRSIQPSGARSGSPFSTMEVMVGTVSPTMISALQP